MPTLNWIGKDKVINHHHEVPFRVLNAQYTFGTDSSENRIIHGNNLEAQKALPPYYEGRIKCIYILTVSVPSAIVTRSRNYLVHTLHLGFREDVTIVENAPFQIDSRLLTH